jgi:hypothetical protein
MGKLTEFIEIVIASVGLVAVFYCVAAVSAAVSLSLGGRLAP